VKTQSVLRAEPSSASMFPPVEFGDHPMLKRYVKLSLISMAILAAGIPLSAAAYIALALIGY
jgi:hypothetical protein